MIRASLMVLFFSIAFSQTARAEGYIGIIPQQQPATPAGEDQKQKDQQYDDKVKKTDQWVKTAYTKLNDGRQEAYDAELTRRYHDMINNIRAGGLGYVHGEMPKFQEHKLTLDEEK